MVAFVTEFIDLRYDKYQFKIFILLTFQLQYSGVNVKSRFDVKSKGCMKSGKLNLAQILQFVKKKDLLPPCLAVTQHNIMLSLINKCDGVVCDV